MKKIIIFIVILAAAGAVYWLVSGDKLQNYYEEAGNTKTPVVQSQSEKYRLLIGKQFPNVELISNSGQSLTTSELVGDGKVILFLDPGCISCEAMANKWIALIGKHTLDPSRVFAVCFLPPTQAAQYHAERQMNFPLYSDTAQYFVKNHDLTDFPLQLVVGKSMTIHESTYDVQRQVFMDQLERWFKN
ncbi:MAG: redoxin domain-containing protein [Candidatus Zixiibacteriota bacterium]